MTSLLFDVSEPDRKRASPRVLMHVVDAGPGCDDAEQVVMQCGKCGHKTGWITVRTMTEAKRGQPCPKCNT
jgi:hypothetical protein